MSEQTERPPEQEQGDGAPVAAAPAAEAEKAEAAGEAEQVGDGLPENRVSVADAGTLRKRVTVEVDRRRIDAKFDEMFGELRRSAMVPGFRKGRAPRRLIEKRFGKEVAGDVRNALVGESVGASLEAADFDPLGEPEIDLEEIELPEEGHLSFSFEVEIKPEFELPQWEGIEVVRPTVTITDERVQQAIDAFRGRFGRMRPIQGPSREGDRVVADVTVRGEGVDLEVRSLELPVGPGHVNRIPLEDLGKTLGGRKPGDTCRLKTRVPAGHPEQEWRDKDVTIEFHVLDIKRLELPELNDELAGQMGFSSVREMRDAVRARLEARLGFEQQRLMREQVREHLLKQTDFEVPPQAAERYSQRLLSRRVVDLMLRGVPREQIERDLDGLTAEAQRNAAAGLKLTFVLEKLADALEIQVEDGEVNARIAEIAREQRRRPERVRHEMRSEGTLELLTAAVREEKAIDRVLASAKITDAAEDRPPAAETKPRKKAVKKAAKKPSAGKASARKSAKGGSSRSKKKS